MYRNNLYLYCCFAGFVLIGATGYSLLSLQMVQVQSPQLTQAMHYHHILDWSLLCLGIILFAGGGWLWHRKTYKETIALRELNRMLTFIQGYKDQDFK